MAALEKLSKRPNTIFKLGSLRFVHTHHIHIWRYFSIPFPVGAATDDAANFSTATTRLPLSLSVFFSLLHFSHFEVYQIQKVVLGIIVY